MLNIREKIRVVQDFPKQGIGFFDITTLLKDGPAFRQVIDEFHREYRDTEFDRIAGTESRGFVFAAALAYKMNKGMIPVRKPGKLPAETYREEYALEYGTDAVEMHRDAVELGMNVLVIDDLLATGGTALATCRLIEKAGGSVAGVGFMIELGFLNGRQQLENYDLYSMLRIEEE
ncbi:adenine phosphoribosyltransferase [candidate division KSB1 bacterium]